VKRSGDLTAHVVGFCRALRNRSIPVGPKEAADALTALAAVDVSDRRESYLALRSVLTSRRDDLFVFDQVFAEYWNPPQEQQALPHMPEPLPAAGDAQASSPTSLRWLDEALAVDGEQTPAYSPVETLTEKDFSAFSADELDEVARIVIRIAKRVATRLSRRMRQSKRGRVDLRRTIRHSLRRGGEIVDLAYRRRKITKTKVVLLADVSGSMDLYSRFLIQFIYALQHTLGHVETLVFSTSLTRVTDALDEADLHRALNEVAKQVPDWSGGTKIGYSLRTFLREHGDQLSPRTVVLIISDGWDTGEMDVLEHAMEEIRRRAGRIIWLNPLLGSPGYEPICQGMRVALPYVDVFASAHNLESLRQLEQHLAAKR